MADQPDRPDPKVPGYVDVRYKDGEPKRVEFEVSYFIDDWYTMEFDFRIEGDTAELAWLEPPGKHYNPAQSEDARHEAIRQVSELPQVEYVEMEPSYNSKSDTNE